MATLFPNDLGVVARFNPDSLVDDNKALRARLEEMEKVMREMKRASDHRVSQIIQDAAAMRDLKDRMAELEKRVHKKNAIIANQDEVISELKKRASAASSEVMASGALQRPGSRAYAPLNSTPLSFESWFPENSGMYGHLPMFDSSGMVTRPASSMASSAGAMPQFSGHSQFGGRVPHASNQLSLINFTAVQNVEVLAQRLQGLFHKTEAFARAHANVPFHVDRTMETSLKHYVRNVSGPAPTSQLLASSKTRYLLVAKVINAFVVNDILKATALRNFDIRLDTVIEQLHRQLLPNTGAVVREALVTAVATQIDGAKRRPGFSYFCQTKVQVYLAQLWRVVASLTAVQSNHVCQELSTIVSQAQTLAVDMFSVPLEYVFEFARHDAPFDPARMINRGAATMGKPATSQQTDARVILGISPRVRIWKGTQEMAVMTGDNLGNVLLSRETE